MFVLLNSSSLRGVMIEKIKDFNIPCKLSLTWVQSPKTSDLIFNLWTKHVTKCMFMSWQIEVAERILLKMRSIFYYVFLENSKITHKEMLFILKLCYICVMQNRSLATSNKQQATLRVSKIIFFWSKASNLKISDSYTHWDDFLKILNDNSVVYFGIFLGDRVGWFRFARSTSELFFHSIIS